MKNLLQFVLLLGLAGSLSLGAQDNPPQRPTPNPIIIGNPILNPAIPRPGPYTPKPKPATTVSHQCGVSD